MIQPRIASIALSGIVIASAALAADAAKTWKSSTFLDRVDGTLLDGGANTYVAADGSIRLIHVNDLNNDGKLDLVAPTDHSQSDGRVDLSVFWGRDGLSAKSVLRLPSDKGKATAVADLNGDGFPDLVLANASSDPWRPYDTGQTSFIYWGGAKGFSKDSRLELPTQSAYGVTVADLDRDGSPDLVFANLVNTISADHLKQSYIYWGDHGRYDVAHRTSLPTEKASDVKAADLNGDGHLDLVISQEGNLPPDGGFTIFWGEAARGAFGRRTTRLKGDSASSVAVGDLDADGVPEIVVANEYRSKGREANGLYSIANEVNLNSYIYWGGKGGTYSDANRTALPTLKTTGVAIGDLNGDRRPDVVFANSSGGVGYGAYTTNGVMNGGQGFIYWNSAEGFAQNHRQSLPTSSGSACAIGDLNGDGFADLAFANQSGANGLDQDSYVYWGGAEGFDVKRRLDLPTFGSIGVQIADLDRDGKADVIFANGNANSFPGNRNDQRVYWGDGSGTFSDKRLKLLPLSSGYNGAGSYAILDLNTDGYVDLAFTGLSPIVLWGGPDGIDVKRSSAISTTYSFYSNFADFNRDGYLDMVCAEFFPGSTVSRVYYGNATGFATASNFPLAVNGPRAMSVGDLNKDGWLDIVFSTVTDSCEMAIFWGGSQGFDNGKVTRLPTGNSPANRLADLNKDGWLDIVIANLYNAKEQPGPGLTVHGFGGNPDGKNMIYWGGPQGYSVDRRVLLPGIGTEDIGVADFNGDGWLDFAASHYSGSSNRQHPSYVYWNGAQGFAADRVTLLPTFAASGVATADYNHDGFSDVRFANHVKDSDHSKVSNFIYFGGRNGIDPNHRAEVYGPGPHLLTGRDIGNIYDRSDRSVYVSPAFDAGSEVRLEKIAWEAETPFKTGVELQVRAAATKEALANAPWQGAFKQSGASLAGVGAGRWIQYQATLISPNEVNSPVLRGVSITYR